MKGGIDQDALIATVDLVRRSGATDFEIGYLHDDVPMELAAWYATATYRGAKLIAEDRRSPDEAADALARKLLDGAQCRHCKKLVRLDDKMALGACRWSRHGARWVRGCEDG